MDLAALAAIVITLVTFVAIVSERIHKTIAALLGGTAMVILNIVHEEEAFESIDLGVVLLLTGMMVISHYLAKSGFFGYVAIRLAQTARGRPVPLLILLCTVTALLSALVDNVTTVVLIAPVTLLIADQLEINPAPFLLFEVMSANIGGTATLIGDPPNILIGSKAGLTFNQFLLNLGPAAALCMVCLLAAAYYVVSKSDPVSSDVRARVREMNAGRAIADRGLMVRSLAVLGIVLTVFLLHGVLDIGPAPVALAGAAVLMLLVRADVEEGFRAVEWPTLFFFVGLFMLVSGLVATGVVDQVAEASLSVTGHSLLLTAMVVLWFSGISAAFIGAIPIVTALIPVIQNIIPVMSEQNGYPEGTVAFALWWSLALGACLGGNGTMFGTAANVIVVEIAHKNRREIGYGKFMAYGMPLMLTTLVISSIYVILRYTL